MPRITSANLTYSAATGGPDEYSIDYLQQRKHKDSLMSLMHRFRQPDCAYVSGAAAGTYNAALTVRNSTRMCKAATTAFGTVIATAPGRT